MLRTPLIVAERERGEHRDAGTSCFRTLLGRAPPLEVLSNYTALRGEVATFRTSSSLGQEWQQVGHSKHTGIVGGSAGSQSRRHGGKPTVRGQGELFDPGRSAGQSQ